jgi:PAS domain S-box-containing protein
LLANQRMVADLGRPAEQIIGVRDVDLYPPEVLHQWHDNDQHVLAADAPLQFEETFPYDGKLQTYLAAKFPLHDEQGNIYAVGVITTNITERKQMEEALRRSEARLDAFFSSAPVGLALLDDQLRYVKINQTAASFNGHSIEAHLGKTVAEILPDLPPAIMPMLQQVLTSGQPILNLEFSAEVTSQPSETLYAEISVFPIMGRNEQPVGLGSILIDVTTRKRAEQERQRLLQELARSARLKDEFLANMSHELRTPLNAIMGLSEALREGIYGPLASRQQATLQTVEESGRHLLDMINDILDLAKIEAGKIDLDWSIVSVVSLCQTCLQLIRQSAHKKRIKVFEDFRQGAAILYADERRLKQMLVNLLSNAVKFTPEGGHIGLTVTGDREQGAVHFTVWDTGIGIAAGDMERLFQPFVQIDSSLARQYEGTGLGLSLVARLAEMHGGSVGVESEPGKGSRFMVSLPWDAESEEHIAWNKVPPHLTTTTPLTPSDTSTPADAPLILLVEDNQTTSEMMASYLSAHGYRLRLARHGAEALEATRDERPALVLMDIQLPHMDGLTAIRQFRADAALVDLPIIAMTALAMPGDRERCLQAGANDYLSKPVSLKYVLQLIETQYSSNQS